jgi:alkanesulfonate monooxygenase SsuD/methylene tetrahydromethanopterin reductase-like flavin-dependent oxidoreductase (luciferase family)
VNAVAARVPLSVLDLVPISSGSNPSQALTNTIDLARHAEAAGYRRYWFAEHHLNPGVAGTAPAIMISLVANATTTLRVGSGGVQLGHRTALSVVEEFGLLDAAFPGRIDLGLGRSGGRFAPPKAAENGAAKPRELSTVGGGVRSGPDVVPTAAPAPVEGRVVDGLLIPPPFSFAHLLSSPRFALQGELLQLPSAVSPDYGDQVADILALIEGTYRAANGEPGRAVPGEGADVQIWILGSSAGISAEVAGRRGLAFAANYHVAPSSVLDAVEAYRQAFVPSDTLDRPLVSVSADVVVGDSDAHARELASGFPLWVRSIRSGAGAVEFPTPAEAARHVWTDDDRHLVQDRVDTQFVGSASTVVQQLEVLQRASGADELVITTITHDHGDRVRSYELLADAWSTS